MWLDTRTKDVVDVMTAKHGSVDAFREISGLPINTYFSASKMKWLIDNVKAVRDAIDEGVCYFGTIDTWIIWVGLLLSVQEYSFFHFQNLTGGPKGGVYITDVTNASRTQLMDINTCQWSEELLEAFGIPRISLPDIRSSSEIYGFISDSGCPDFDGVPISGVSCCTVLRHAMYLFSSVPVTNKLLALGKVCLAKVRSNAHMEQERLFLSILEMSQLHHLLDFLRLLAINLAQMLLSSMPWKAL